MLDTLSRDSGGPVLGLVGGGLQNALIALATLSRKPDAALCMIEREQQFGGNHTWCFHDGDVPSDVGWLDPLVVQTWPAYEVKFPGLSRRLHQRYSMITSERLDAVLKAALHGGPNARALLGNARAVIDGRVELDDGAVLDASFVVDARGPEHAQPKAQHFQKFLGLELAIAPGTAPRLPMLMDASVEQRDGFRFFYVLPLAPDRVLVEDTYYSDTPNLDRDALRAEVLGYARARGLQLSAVLREETGVLPLPTAAVRRASEPSPKVLRAGYQGGYFHPTTGYSLPCAVRIARHVATHWPGPLRNRAFDELSAQHDRQVRFCIALNRLLFGAFEPERRFEVLQRFYRLPEDTIRRFYALDTSLSDRAQILCGRPPKGFSAWRLYKTRGAQA